LNKFTGSFFFLLLFSISLFGQNKASYLISENPQELTFLDKYQQHISNQEKSAFEPFTPFLILKKSEPLGDGLSFAHRVSYAGATYFILVAEDGKINNPSDYNPVAILNNCRLINDTILITRDNSISVIQNIKPRGNGSSLEKSDILIRHFKYKSYYFVSYAGDYKQFGWSKFGKTNSWQKVKLETIKKDIELNAKIKIKIQRQFKNANEAYKTYITFFNKQSGKQKQIPRWEFTFKGSELKAKLNSRHIKINSLRESTLVLVRNLENILLGKPYSVSYKSGTLSIKQDVN